MADQLYPTEGLTNILMNMIAGANQGSSQVIFDLILSPTPPYSLSNQFGLMTFAVNTGVLTASAPNANGNNTYITPDFTIQIILGVTAVVASVPCTFNNPNSFPISVYGQALWDPLSQPYNVISPSSPLLIAISAFDSYPVTIPPGGNYIASPILGDQSLLSM
jgi:hypothetical protein